MKQERNIKAFGLNVKKIRKSKHITQEQLAFEIGIEVRHLGRIERGEINTGIGSVFQIAKALGVEPKELFEF